MMLRFLRSLSWVKRIRVRITATTPRLIVMPSGRRQSPHDKPRNGQGVDAPTVSEEFEWDANTHRPSVGVAYDYVIGLYRDATDHLNAIRQRLTTLGTTILTVTLAVPVVANGIAIGVRYWLFLGAAIWGAAISSWAFASSRKQSMTELSPDILWRATELEPDQYQAYILSRSDEHFAANNAILTKLHRRYDWLVVFFAIEIVLFLVAILLPQPTQDTTTGGTTAGATAFTMQNTDTLALDGHHRRRKTVSRQRTRPR